MTFILVINLVFSIRKGEVISHFPCPVQNTKIDSKANSPSYGDYGCFFIALNSKVYLFIPLATVHSKTFTLKEIAVAGGGHMGTQNTFNLAWKLMNGLLFESTDSNVVFLFKDTYKGHAILGTARLDIV